MPRLAKSDTTSPGFTRRRRGKGFEFVAQDGAPVPDAAALARMRDLVIPPAWEDVWIAPLAHGHIQATGIDAAGRRQYIYHQDWTTRRDAKKFERMLELAATMPSARASVTRDLRTEGLSRERVLAGAFRMLDASSVRPGSEQYTEAHGSYGLTTLLGAHATVHGGDTVELNFPGKSGQPWTSAVQDEELARLVSELKRRGPRSRLLAWKHDDEWRRVTPTDINDDVRSRTKGDFTAKDFRTLTGTIAAAEYLAKAGPQATESRRRREVAAAMRHASDVLGNTPAIARKSYVDPRVVDRFNAGITMDTASRRAAETRLIELLGD